MMRLFGRRDSPKELVDRCKENFVVLSKKNLTDPKVYDKAVKEVTSCLQEIKQLLFGGEGREADEEATKTIVSEAHTTDLLLFLVLHLESLEFETRKQAMAIFTCLLRRQTNNRLLTVEYIQRNLQILDLLVQGYEKPDVALLCGSVLRECIRYEPLSIALLNSDKFYLFFGYVDQNNFEIASDAYQTLKELLTKHKAPVAAFLEANFDRIFQDEYVKLLNSQNYVTRRQCLKLLGELLLDRSNFNNMTKYISKPENLKLMMNMLRDKSKNIQFEAFHVFKVFVANPNKAKPIRDILFMNKERLITFLKNFFVEKEAEDEQFKEEKALLLQEIGKLTDQA